MLQTFHLDTILLRLEMERDLQVRADCKEFLPTPDVQDGQNLGQVGPRQMFKMDEIWGKLEKKADLQTVTSGTNLQNPPQRMIQEEGSVTKATNSHQGQVSGWRWIYK